MAQPCYVPAYAVASYKGVAAEAMEASVIVGRRAAFGEFPFSEIGAGTDLGRKLRHYKMRVRFADNSHIADAMSFLSACESPGPGALVHPEWGADRAICISATSSARPVEEQGVSYVDAEWVECPDWFAFGGLGATLVSVVIDGLFETVGAAFGDLYDLRAAPFYELPDVLALSGGLAGEIANTLRSVAGIEPNITVYDVLTDLDALAADPSPLSSEQATWTLIKNGLAAVDYYAPAADRHNAFRRLANWAARPVMVAGMSGQASDALLAATRILAAGYMARAASETVPANCADALVQHDRVAALLWSEAREAAARCDGRLHMAVSTFAAETLATLLRRAYGLPAFVTYELPGAMSSLAAAHEIYGDGRRFTDLENLNRRYLPVAFGPTVVAVRSAA